ncbi:hypothetical protein ACVW1B_000497 [Bradyrhizobium sp. USDA 4502]|nr:hypothetical protein [Bradyrhizobium sp. USDA 4538]MCP1898946.1 hypothetical protein [Bradyrhizobium sp. USDA 4537]MCP1986940.1 hypothetical protein [Bradyrhizobium sp. USDA 4539]
MAKLIGTATGLTTEQKEQAQVRASAQDWAELQDCSLASACSQFLASARSSLPDGSSPPRPVLPRAPQRAASSAP